MPSSVCRHPLRGAAGRIAESEDRTRLPVDDALRPPRRCLAAREADAREASLGGWLLRSSQEKNAVSAPRFRKVPR